MPNHFFYSFLVFLFVSANLFASESAPDAIVRITPNLEKFHLDVSVEFTGQKSGETPILVQGEWANHDYSKAIYDYTVMCRENCLPLVPTDQDQIKLLRHSPSASIKISYKIKPMADHLWDIYGSLITKDLIHIPGYALLSGPVVLGQEVLIEWCNLPNNWKTFSSFGNSRKIVTCEPEICHSMLMAGNFTKDAVFHQPKAKLHVVFHGVDENCKPIAEQVFKIVDLCRNYFNDFDFPPFVVSIFKGIDLSSMGGTAVENFLAVYTNDIHSSAFTIVLAHEYVHTWLGGRIGSQQPEGINYWWCEGFTDYFCRKILVEGGLMTQKEYLLEIEQFVGLYQNAIYKNAPNERIIKDFWNDLHVETLPYNRGFVFALYLDDAIQKFSADKDSLKNVMLDLLDRAKASKEPYEFNVPDFLDVTNKYLGEKINEKFQDWIIDGKTIDVDAGLLK